jgi:acyl-CoA synthetase (AMP-forming)/AMP-acid ligase II
MRVVTTTDSELDAAWAAPATFALLPDRSPVDGAWVTERLRGLPEDLREHCFALLTSGSTGRPKLIVGRRDRAEALARTLHGVQGNEPCAEALVALPLSYSFAFVNQWVWARVTGRALRRSPGLADPSGLRAALARADAALLCLVGVQGALIAEQFAGEAFDGVARLHFAGGRFPQEHLERLRSIFPAAVISNNFGCAEAMPRLTYRRAEAADDAADVGWPLPGVELRTQAAGAIAFRSPFRAVAVADETGLRRLAEDDWVATGDVGEPGPDGRWRVTGRAHEVFKRHGEKVQLAAVVGAVSQAWDGELASYRDRDRRGEDGWVLVLAPAPEPPQVRPLLRLLRDRFARAHWPLRIEGVPSLPRLPNGKVDARRLAGAAATTIAWDQRA